MCFLVPDFYSVFFTISFRRTARRTFFKLPAPTELMFLGGQAPSCISASCVYIYTTCVYTNVYTCKYAHVFTYTHIYTYIYIYIYEYIYIYMYVCVYTHIYTHIYICIYVCIYIYICIDKYVYIYTFIYIYIYIYIHGNAPIICMWQIYNVWATLARKESLK